MATVAATGITKMFGQCKALDNVSITFPNGGFYALLGPSGSGKTTLLRLIAGFDFPDSGVITFAGKPVDSVPVERRDVGMMFQNYALFPNMSVYDNVAFGLTVRHLTRREIKQRVGEVVELVRLSGLENRYPHQLSGGQKQRVALSRALVIRPRVLLLDEPLSALDKSLRMEMQVELKRIQREVGITAIFVTHDQEEALTMSDSVGILRDGTVVQQGTPHEIYERPQSAFAATFLGVANLFDGKLHNGIIELVNGTVIRSSDLQDSSAKKITCAVRPEKMTMHTANDKPPVDANMIVATVVQHIFTGSSLTYLLSWDGGTIRVFAQNSGDNILSAGDLVTVAWLPAHTILLIT